MTFVFIDGEALRTMCQSLGWQDIDFSKLRAWIAQRWPDLGRVTYYSSISDDPNDPFVPVLRWLETNGYSVVRRTVPVKRMQYRRARSMDVRIAVDAMGLVRQMSECVFITGTEDMNHLVKTIRDLGPRTTVIHSRKSTPSVADQLRKSPDTFVEIAELQAVLEKKA